MDGFIPGEGAAFYMLSGADAPPGAASGPRMVVNAAASAMDPGEVRRPIDDDHDLAVHERPLWKLGQRRGQLREVAKQGPLVARVDANVRLRP
jgi:hypothetical protein